MTDTGDWQPTFDAVHNIPGKTKQQPAKKTVQSLKEDTELARRRYSSDVAVGLGMVDTGSNDPWAWLSEFAGGIADSFANQGQVLTEHTEAIATLEEVAAATNTTPAWVSDVDDMATIPRSAVTVMGFGPSTGTGSRPKFQDILTAYSISDGDGAFYGVTPTIRPTVQQFGTSLGNIYYAPIVVDRTGTVGSMRWIVGADTSIFSINYYEMALCILNPANGNLEKVWGSGNIKNAEADTTAISEVVIDMGINQQCEPGQILFAAHQQTAPSILQTPRRFAAVPLPDMPRTVTLLDAWCYVAPNHSQGIPSSIDFGSLTRENRFVPWMSVSVTA